MAESFNNDAASVNGKYFRQGANITFDKTVENNFTPVKTFNGHYDGAGFVISGVNISLAAPKEASLFGSLEGNATIKNVVVKNSAFKGNGAAVVAAAVFGNAGVENCHVLKDVTVESDTNAGGVVSVINGNGARVTGCTSQATVKGFSGVGGIAGLLTTGYVGNSIALGNGITGSANVNAVVGYRRNGTVENCYFTAPTLSDPRAKLMPDKREDNTDFLTRLHQRDEFLLQAITGLTAEQIGYDLTLQGRTIEATQAADGTWKSKAFSVCLPFDIDILKLDNADDISVYKLHQVDLVNKVFQFTNDFPILKAGEPYMIVINKGSMPLTGRNVTIVPTPKEPQAVNNADASKQIGWWCGTFRRIENDEIFRDYIYIAQKDKTFQYPPKGYTKAFTYPFIAYFSAMEPLDFIIAQTKYIHTENGVESGDVADFPADEFDSDGEFGEATGISPVIQTIDADGTEHYYDLQGRQLSGKPNKGIYIYKGKKVVK